MIGMETITRKSLIYKSGLGFYCLNHVQGCSHGCRYPCYAFSMARHYGRAAGYKEWRRPKLVTNALELLDKELPKLRAKAAAGPGAEEFRVHLCLTTDPFMVGWPEIQSLSLRIIEKINAGGLACDVLTKGVLPPALAGPAFSRKNHYGISLISLNESFRQRWEPGAAPYADRIRALRYLHDQGFPTYAHIEPYPTPNIVRQDFGALLEAVAFVDSIYFGGWNYSPLARKYPDRAGFYAEMATKVKSFCHHHGINCEME
ncbi:MAG: radical SAM protein [Chitinispirillaceae bacterium]|jgi:DNA repair photolyase